MDRMSVLVIDPDRGWSERLCESLEQNGWNAVRPAYDGKEALAYIDANRPGVIITELLLDEFDGLYLVTYIRSLNEEYNPLVYVLSGISVNCLIKSSQILSESWDNIHIAKKPQSIPCVIKNIEFLTQERTAPFPQFPLRVLSEPEGISRELDNKIENFLFMLDHRCHLKRFICVKTALAFLLMDESTIYKMTALYQKVADQVGGTKGSVERNMRSFREGLEAIGSDYYLANLAAYNDTNSDFYWNAIRVLKSELIDKIS